MNLLSLLNNYFMSKILLSLFHTQLKFAIEIYLKAEDGIQVAKGLPSMPKYEGLSPSISGTLVYCSFKKKMFYYLVFNTSQPHFPLLPLLSVSIPPPSLPTKFTALFSLRKYQVNSHNLYEEGLAQTQASL